eukprot:CAMPEP_0169483628 /NCGR_PEP_ID=MMETSP1042-20121227/31313_1 /TAXON_ID=464988 /ORGANISM="Hemiselmis andersenii, Strain CCMP1180" /LENGTH=257 /DNA_ID=CAMNT_0009598581 /DNA_START=570 /DNA_END=1342 /DNA_ORIENTATION=+
MLSQKWKLSSPLSSSAVMQPGKSSSPMVLALSLEQSRRAMATLAVAHAASREWQAQMGCLCGKSPVQLAVVHLGEYGPQGVPGVGARGSQGGGLELLVAPLTAQFLSSSSSAPPLGHGQGCVSEQQRLRPGKRVLGRLGYDWDRPVCRLGVAQVLGVGKTKEEIALEVNHKIPPDALCAFAQAVVHPTEPLEGLFAGAVELGLPPPGPHNPHVLHHLVRLSALRVPFLGLSKDSRRKVDPDQANQRLLEVWSHGKER